jgi:hypothetical protein
MKNSSNRAKREKQLAQSTVNVQEIHSFKKNLIPADEMTQEGIFLSWVDKKFQENSKNNQ